MDITRLLMRLSRLARNPPSLRNVIIGAVAIGIGLLIVAIERGGYWPEGWGAERMRPPVVQQSN